MNEDIRRLVQLQGIAIEMRELDGRRAEAPTRLAAIEEAFEQRIQEIGEERLTHERLVAECTSLREEREQLQQRLERSQQKLMQVSNQREYSAVLNEIDATKAELSKVGDGIAERELRIEELAGPAAEADTRIAAERATTDEQKKAIETELDEQAQRLEQLKADREQLVAEIPPRYLRRFDSVFKGRGGLAMAAIQDGACGACHVRLRPQVISLVRRGEELIICDSCRRYLYIEPTPEEGEASEAGETPPPESGADGNSLPGSSASVS